MMKNKWIALLLVFAMLFAAGCASSKSDRTMAKYEPQAPAAAAPMTMTESAVFEEAYAADMAMEMPAENGAYMSVPQTDSGAGAENIAEPNYGGRKIIRRLGLDLRTDRFDEHKALIERDVQTAGGYIENSYVYGTKPEVAGDSGRSASFTLRIPVKQVDAFVNTASTYGTLISQNEDSEDVTDSYFDIETRLEVSRTTLERLQSILVKTNNLADVIELEREIARVTVEIELLTTKLRKYDGLIEYATVNITLNEEGMKIGPAAKTPFGQRISDGFFETLSDVGNFLEDFVVVLIGGLPVLLPIALIVWLVLWLRKRSIRKDIENGMPENFVGWQRRAWRKDRRMAMKNGVNMQNMPPQNAQEAKKDGEK